MQDSPETYLALKVWQRLCMSDVSTSASTSCVLRVGLQKLQMQSVLADLGCSTSALQAGEVLPGRAHESRDSQAQEICELLC